MTNGKGRKIPNISNCRPPLKRKGLTMLLLIFLTAGLVLIVGEVLYEIHKGKGLIK